MGAKFTKELIDGTLVCDPRGGWCAKMGLQDTAETENWTELITAAFVSATGIADNNEAWPAETIASTGAFDRFLWGIKDDDDSKLIGVAGTYFAGFSSIIAGATSIDTSGQLNQTSPNCATSSGTTVNNSTSAMASFFYRFSTTVNAVAATNYAQFMGMRFVRTNVGTATEQIRLFLSVNGGATHTDTSLSALRTLVNSYTSHQHGGGGVLLAFNDGAAAYPTPDTWYVRWPFLNSRLRIHSAMFQVNAL